MAKRTIRLGIAGLGRAFTLMLPTLNADSRVQLIAAADARADARHRFETDYGGETYASVEDLCNSKSIEAVYIATPHQDHARHVQLAAARGKHVLVEKPMAITIEQCALMVDAARRAGTHLIVGHSHSFDAPIRRAREIIASGAYGAVKMIQALNYTDYMYRPRRPEELDTSQGGGVVFSQAAHQIDVIRLLGGGEVQSVRAATGSWDPSRPTEGAYSALLTFKDGAFCTANYSGYAHFDSDEFSGWIGEMGLPKEGNRYAETRTALKRVKDPSGEAALKNDRNYGGKNYTPSPIVPSPPRQHQHFGLIIATCERADLRPTPEGVLIYDGSGMRLEPVPVPAVPRVEVIDELYDAIVEGRPAIHSGEWAMATLEICLSILTSQKNKSEIQLKHQYAIKDTAPRKDI